MVGGSSDPRGLSGRERSLGLCDAGATLYFDKRQSAASSGNQIDLAEGRAMTPRQNSIALRHEQDRGDHLGEQPSAQPCPALVISGLGVTRRPAAHGARFLMSRPMS